MHLDSFEIEIKSLLGSKEKADELLSKLKQLDPKLQEIHPHKQLNHYFINPEKISLTEELKQTIPLHKYNKLSEMIEKAKEISFRTREADESVLLVAKASVDDTTSSNGIARMEFEEPVNLTLEELDNLLLKAGFTYQAKWSRERRTFIFHPSSEWQPFKKWWESNEYNNEITVMLDKNAGYGYLAEFEIIINYKEKTDLAKEMLKFVMEKCGVEELSQDRLARMFDFYNKNWREYYGTEKTFVIE